MLNYRRKLEPISVLTEVDWTKQHDESFAKSAGGEVHELD